MPTEAIHISTGTILRYRVIIIISITVQYEIMTSPHQIKTNSHAIVHRQILVNIMISTLIVYTLRLSMLPDSNLCFDNLKIAEMEVAITNEQTTN
mgnify:CR=1 FL=1